jgi:hypothetical protein
MAFWITDLTVTKQYQEHLPRNTNSGRGAGERLRIFNRISGFQSIGNPLDPHPNPNNS